MQTPPDPSRGPGGVSFARGRSAQLGLTVREDPVLLANEPERFGGAAAAMPADQRDVRAVHPQGVNRASWYARSAGCVRACTSCSRATETRV